LSDGGIGLINVYAVRKRESIFSALRESFSNRIGEYIGVATLVYYTGEPRNQSQTKK